MPSARFEYASAKIKIVRIRPIDVRGMIADGRCVSSAACEIDSSPTNEMMASETPCISMNGVGQNTCIECTSRSGLNVNRKPKKRIVVSLTTSSALTIPLNAVLSRTPITLSTAKPTISTSTKIKWDNGCCVADTNGIR